MPDEVGLEKLLEQVHDLHQQMVQFEKSMQAVLTSVHQQHRTSARNLLHYLAFRREDVRDLQGRLAALGLSSLGRSEASVLTTLQQVLAILACLTDQAVPDYGDVEASVCYDDGKKVLARNTVNLLGPDPEGRHVRIMVTMCEEAAHTYEHVRDLIVKGMNCMRINCAHDGPAVWAQMIEHLQRAREETKKPCCILMDVGGPKLRTGPLAPGPAIHKWKPTRDPFGRVVEPVLVQLVTSMDAAVDERADFRLTIPSGWLERIRIDDQIWFTDARGAKRILRVTEVGSIDAWAQCQQTAYLVPGLKLRLRRFRKADKKWQTLTRTLLRDVPPVEQTVLLRCGDGLLLTGNQKPGRPALCDDAGQIVEPARIGCTLPEVFADLQAGEQIWFDDGKIGGRIVRVDAACVEVEITQAHPDGSKLGPDKGINLPDSRLRLSALTSKDIEDLPFIVRHADLVGYSFVRTPHDVHELQDRLEQLDGANLGIVLKIETGHAFENLPHLLLAVMRSPRAGVMIARGDLAVECGFERLAELQEEILWFCEAAHLPVIWATQVLEHLAKEGVPSRAEITDAAMGERAECVMLNKGRHVFEAVQTLDNILKRMASHQMKKYSLLRRLNLAGRFSEEPS